MKYKHKSYATLGIRKLNSGVTGAHIQTKKDFFHVKHFLEVSFPKDANFLYKD